MTSGALAVLHAAAPARPGGAAEVTVLIGANLAATAIRFAIYRHWVFRGRAAAGEARRASRALRLPPRPLTRSRQPTSIPIGASVDYSPT